MADMRVQAAQLLIDRRAVRKDRDFLCQALRVRFSRTKFGNTLYQALLVIPRYLRRTDGDLAPKAFQDG